MKLFVLTILLWLSSINIYGQYRPLHNFVYFKGGVRFSNFVFSDRESESNILNFSYINAFSLSISYALTTDENKHQLLPELSFFQAGARALYTGNQAEWRLNYVGIGSSYLCKVLDRQQVYKFGLLAGLNMGLDYLISGRQTVNSIGFDVKKSDAFKAMNFRMGPVIMGKYLITPRVQASLEYRFDIGLNNIEKNDASTQVTRNLGHTYLFGLAIKL